MTTFSVRDLTLAVPAEGGREHEHDETFTTWDEVFSGIRDGINAAIGHLNGFGAGLPELPGGSLEEMLVIPLTGDYRLIRQNGNGCAAVEGAMAEWGANIGRLAHRTPLVWRGEAALAFMAHLEACDVVVRLLGRLVGLGTKVFDLVADVSERLGVQVERLIVALGRLLRRLAIRIAEKLAGAGGWTKLAYDVITKGIHVVTDIIDDIQLVIELIEAAIEVRDAIEEWATVQKARLELLTELPQLLRALPEVGRPGSVDPATVARVSAELGTAMHRGTTHQASAAIDKLAAKAAEGMAASA